MALAAGTRLGPYEILAAIGAGGMGEVYRARDTRLARDVALKILPDAFILDQDRLARFKREAQVLAAINHPNIAAIYGFEESNAVQALVLELVEGPTLADRIAQGSIALDDALPIARQIAEALEAAHDQGIVHRDLKPANIKVRPDGTVKVLDFGLAKALEPVTGAIDVSQSPTITSPAMTRMGVILGTAAYMSPEQAKGQKADRTADVWAFGCVLYEMLTGRRAFEGETVSETLAEVLKTEPDWRRLPAETPEGIRRLLRRCLQKERKHRLHDMADARLEIDEAQSGPQADGRVAPSASRRGERFAWVSALALLVLLVAAVMALVRRPFPSVPPAPETRFEITTPPTPTPASLAISPDGQKIVFSAVSEGRSRLWLRLLDSVSARPLSGTDFGLNPFWSPDSRSVGFVAESTLKRIDIDDGSVRMLARAVGNGGAWNRDGTILFAPSLIGSIFRISAAGGEPSAVTRLETPQQVTHRFPQFLPDGRHFLYEVTGAIEVRGIYIGQLGGSETRRVLDADSVAVHASGRLLFVRQGTAFAQNFDPVRLALAGNPSPVAEQVLSGSLSASGGGPIVYRPGSAATQRQFVWFERSGKEIGNVGAPDAVLLNPSLSPDARRVAVQRRVNQNTDIWLLEVGNGAFRRLTFEASTEAFPIWSPDGSRIAFNGNRKGTYDLYQKPATGAGSDELLLPTGLDKNPMDWSPDGRFLLYRSRDPKTLYDLWALPMEGDRKPFPVVQTNFDERDGQFSPDGKWIAYQSNESAGRFEIYVQPFPGPGKWQISTNGGAQVRWRRDGKELFYIGLDGRLMAVPIRLASNGQAVEPGTPVPLFATRIGGAVQGVDRQQYMVSPDGQRFLMKTVTEEASTSSIMVILNWKAKP